MIQLNLLIINLLLVTASIEETCNINQQTENDDQSSCSAPGTALNYEKLLFYDVNPAEGFNLRRDVYMRFAIMLANSAKKGLKTNWHLVLPPWYGLVHWRSESYRSPPKHWGNFFDVEALKSFAPVLEMYEIPKHDGQKTLQIDTLYVLENYDDPFENGEFKDKWEVSGPCNYEGSFWGYHNVTAMDVICVKFQGRVSQLWELIALHPTDKKIMIHHGEIPLHDHYGSKTYWDCRKSTKFSKKLDKVAKNYISKTLNCNTERCSNYLSIHYRHRDFFTYRADKLPSIKGTPQQIDKTIKSKSLKIKNIFIASDCEESILHELEHEFKKLGYNLLHFMPSKQELEEYRDGGVAIIDQIICSHAAFFVGSHDSTFTYRIQEEREILGFESSTTFNRLCPDVGKCERPSKWTIVN